MCPSAPDRLPKDPDQHRPKRPVLLAVDQELGPERDLSPISRPSSSVPLDRSREVSLVSELVRSLLARRRISATSMRRMCCGLISI
jgi:hypothetical protein